MVECVKRRIDCVDVGAVFSCPRVCLIDVSPVSVEDQFSASAVNIGIAVAL
jgi:hypothetical protein